ncbi:MAG: hypothetical protein IJV19_05310 [Prevotella sp.]|nr:hypothetical protein [Prevotella sp.]
MKTKTLLMIVAAALMEAACGNKQKMEPKQTIGLQTKIEGDTTLYGLACDGCTDSVLIFLPGQGGDPVTYDILEAMKHHRILGRPKVGDWVCIIVNGEDSTKADMAINLDKLKGTWVRMEMPTLKKKMNTNDLLSEEEKEERDSAFMAQMVPQEIGFSLRRHYEARPIGLWRPNVDEDSPIVYPKPKSYTKWHIFNGHLVLTIGSLMAKENEKVKEEHDTVDITLLQTDSLRIRFKDGTENGYSRKQ